MLDKLPVSPVLLAPLVFAFLLVIVIVIWGKVPVGYNVRNLRVRWLTTLLTALAFTLVVGLLTCMMAFVNGMNKLTENSGQPGNVVVFSRGATDELFSNIGYNDTANIENAVARKDADGRPLPQPVPVETIERQGKKAPLVSRETYVVVNQPIPNPGGEPERRRFVQIRGVVDPEISGKVHGIELFGGGQWFSDAGVQPLQGANRDEPPAIQAVVGDGAARLLGGDFNKPKLEINDVFDLMDRKWIVVGVMQSGGTVFDSEIWAKQFLVGPYLNKNNFTSVVVRTKDGETAKVMATYLTDSFNEGKGSGAAGIQAQTESAYYNKLTETNRQFSVAIIFVAIIMAIGGVFGVMNTMFAAVSQRIKDLGVLRILGFARWQILSSLILESLFIAVLGGAVGIALGSLCHGVNATSTVSSGQGGAKSVALTLVVTSSTICLGLVFTVVMGILGGFLPALRAMWVRPLEAMR